MTRPGRLEPGAELRHARDERDGRGLLIPGPWALPHEPVAVPLRLRCPDRVGFGLDGAFRAGSLKVTQG